MKENARTFAVTRGTEQAQVAERSCGEHHSHVCVQLVQTFIGLVLAAILHVAGSLLIVFNSFRLVRQGEELGAATVLPI